MNSAEIMTLIAGKVKASTIRTSILAGKVQGILRAADRQVAEASEFREQAAWQQILTILEGTLDDKKDFEAESSESESKPIKGSKKKGWNQDSDSY